MSLIGLAALAVILGYLAVTLVFQFRPLSLRLAGLDRFGILPRWKFFTQGNDTHDVCIEVRDRYANGRLGAWNRIDPAPPRRLWNALWYPEKYRAGMIRLAIEVLERRAGNAEDVGPESSLAYRTILHICRDASRPAEGFEARQFALMRMRGGREGARWVLFTSNFHTF